MTGFGKSSRPVGKSPASRISIIVAIVATLALAGCDSGSGDEISRIGRPVDPAQFDGPRVSIKVDLPGAKDTVKLVRLHDRSIAYVVQRPGAGTDRVLTPDEFTNFLYRTRASGGWIESLFNITSPAGIAWVALGLLGQLVFTGRMLVQWVASERSRRSVIPVAFWWMSLGGAIMLVIYFSWRRDIVGILGQGTGLFVYARNLMLIRDSRGS